MRKTAQQVQPSKRLLPSLLPALKVRSVATLNKTPVPARNSYRRWGGRTLQKSLPFEELAAQTVSFECTRPTRFDDLLLGRCLGRGKLGKVLLATAHSQTLMAGWRVFLVSRR